MRQELLMKLINAVGHERGRMIYLQTSVNCANLSSTAPE